MKLPFTIIFSVLIQISLFGIERYAKGDTLYSWANKLNLRESPNLDSKVINQIKKGELVTVQQNKYFKEEDIQINLEAKNWEKAITGKWVEVNYKKQKGFLFDAYLSKYQIELIRDKENFHAKNELRIPGFESYERIIKSNGIILETGVGTEWGKRIFYIPDLSLEEAIYFIKEELIDKEFGKRKWEINLEKKEIKMSEKDDLFLIELRINKIENLCVITIEDSM
ncbi:MAG: SH3 domain-containing protein [Bacteroidetes bacterium]|nr:SH3 domain-containing protein [Bacteroidota bacterium]